MAKLDTLHYPDPGPQDVKGLAYKGLVRPVLEYGSSVWDPSSILLQEELEKVQKRAARFVTSNYIYETGSMSHDWHSRTTKVGISEKKEER